MTDTTHADHKSHKKEYFFVFISLSLLTALELYIPSLHNLTYLTRTSCLIFLAIGKAFLVAYYFMHLKQETGWLKFIAAIPISAAIYTAVVVLESMYR